MLNVQHKISDIQKKIIDTSIFTLNRQEFRTEQ